MFLLDTNICSAMFRRPAIVAHRMFQYSGRLYIPTIVLGELHAWAYSLQNPQRILTLIDELKKDVQVLLFDENCAVHYGQARAKMLKVGLAAGEADLMIAAVALAHDLVLVTNNTADFVNVPDLTIVDWLKD